MTNRQIAAQVLLRAIDNPEQSIESILNDETHQWELTQYELQLVREEIDNLMYEQAGDNA